MKNTTTVKTRDTKKSDIGKILKKEKNVIKKRILTKAWHLKTYHSI